MYKSFGLPNHSAFCQSQNFGFGNVIKLQLDLCHLQLPSSYLLGIWTLLPSRPSSAPSTSMKWNNENTIQWNCFPRSWPEAKAVPLTESSGKHLVEAVYLKHKFFFRPIINYNLYLSVVYMQFSVLWFFFLIVKIV